MNSQLAAYPNLGRTVRKWPRLPPVGTTLIIQVSKRGDGCSPRNVAACELVNATRAIIYLSPDLEDMPAPKRDGVVLHELGHALLMLGGDVSHTEREADAEAERVFGIRIYYDPKDLIQTTARGLRPRPASLG